MSAVTAAAAVPQGLTRPRAILFDWDNTLVDSWTTIHEALNAVMAAMEKPLWSLRETKERVRLSLRESFPLHFGDRWEEARRIYLDAQTRSLLGAVDCSSIERPHSNPAPFANVKIHGLTLPCVNERIKSGRKCAQRRLKHFHDQRGIITYVRM